jgi:hypothetical protein
MLLCKRSLLKEVQIKWQNAQYAAKKLLSANRFPTLTGVRAELGKQT